MSIKDQVLKKVEELGDQAPTFFGYSAKSIESWKKRPNGIPLRAIEKVLDPPQFTAPTTRQSSTSVVPPRNPNPMMEPPLPKTDTPQPIQAAQPPYTVESARADIVAIVGHFNEKVSPVIQSIKAQTDTNANMLTNLAENLRFLMEWKASVDNLVPSQQSQAPTVGQLLAAQPSDFQVASPQDIPSRLNPARNATTIAEFNPGSNGHPLDTGIAPSAADRARSLSALAEHADPNNPRRAAGPATPPPQDAPGLRNWSQPWPAKK